MRLLVKRAAVPARRSAGAWGFGCATAAVISLLSVRASAGPAPEFVQVVVHPGEPARVTARYINGGTGFLQSLDAGETWRLGCGALMTPGEKLDGPIQASGHGQIYVPTFTGAWQGSPDGCSWARVPELEGKRVTRIASSPLVPHTLYASTGDGADGAVNGLFARGEDGRWTEVGAPSPTLLVGVMAGGRGGNVRLYALGLLPADPSGPLVPGGPRYVIRFSDDQGSTWSEHALPPEGRTSLEAVDPTRADRIVARVEGKGNANHQVLVSDDGGASFRVYARITSFGGITLAPDGRVWIGDAGSRADLSAPRGIWTAPNLDTAPTQLQASYGVSCLTYSAANDTLYACDQSKIGKVDLMSGALSVLADLNNIRDLATCEGKDVATVCELQFCSGVCEATHFPNAPVCAGYTRPGCGPSPARGSGPPTSPASSGAAGGGSTTLSSGSAAAAPAPDGASGSMNQAARPHDGCHVASRTDFVLGAGWLAFLLVARRRWWRCGRIPT